jgi:peptidoglycan/xylan/chitin deacetylase (PgdA/CDA1 family)
MALSIMMIFLTSTLALTLALYVLYLFVPQWDLWLFRAKRRAKRNGPICCLTFDDGPSKEWTPQVLDILKEYGIKSTFFITGKRARANPDITKRIALEGHEIGNHTMTHRKLTFCSLKTLRREISECAEVIKSITGKYPVLFRAPHGFKPPLIKIRNVIARSDTTRQSRKNHGIATTPAGSRNDYLEQFMSVPWTKGLWDTDMPSAEELLRRLNKKFDPLEILLLHDGIDNRPIQQNRKSTVEALPKIIEEYKKRGYTFMTIGNLNKY